MIVPPTSVRVYVATKPVDFRKGMDGLAAIVEGEFKLEPFSGIIYVCSGPSAPTASSCCSGMAPAYVCWRSGLKGPSSTGRESRMA